MLHWSAVPSLHWHSDNLNDQIIRFFWCCNTGKLQVNWEINNRGSESYGHTHRLWLGLFVTESYVTWLCCLETVRLRLKDKIPTYLVKATTSWSFSMMPSLKSSLRLGYLGPEVLVNGLWIQSIFIVVALSRLPVAPNPNENSTETPTRNIATYASNQDSDQFGYLLSLIRAFVRELTVITKDLMQLQDHFTCWSVFAEHMYPQPKYQLDTWMLRNWYYHMEVCELNMEFLGYVIYIIYAV